MFYKSGMIGTLAEKSLHAGLKEWYWQPDDLAETRVDGFIIDIKRGNTLVEIQTRQLYKLRRKLLKLLECGWAVQLMYPLATHRWVVRQSADGVLQHRRKSPKRGVLADVFIELAGITSVLLHEKFSLQVVLVEQEDIWRNDGQGSWRRKNWSLYDHRLLAVHGNQFFNAPNDYLASLPPSLPALFTNKDIRSALNCSYRAARCLTFTLREMGLLAMIGIQGRQYVYQKTTV